MSLWHWAPSAGRGELRRMLEALGIESVDELYRDIPVEARYEGWDQLPVGEGRVLREAEAAERVERLLSRNRVYRDPPPFLGGGAWVHYVPLAVRYVIERGEFLTSYTPYQAEASQGLLQALFEYQSLIADLYEMDVVNSSLYEGGSAAGEAALMALRVNRGRRRILVAETVNPMRLEAMENYVSGKGVVERVPVDPETGSVRLDALEERLRSGDVAAVYIEYPSYIGVVDENLEAAGEAAHKHGALYVLGADPLAVALYKPPGRLGADIAVGDGQPLGLGLNYGGPSLGIMATRFEARLVRQMPGRIVGLTRDSEGRRAFALILQTREQHIRRARATSNITTNEALMAIAAAAYLALHGGHGLREVAETIWYKTRYAAKRLSEAGLQAPAHSGEYWRDILVAAPAGFRVVQERLAEKGILVGPPVEGATPWLGPGHGLVAVTEMHSRRHIDALAEAVGEVLEGVQAG